MSQVAQDKAKSIVFVGMMGAGKTAIGRVLADRLGRRFVDSDDAIEDAANLKISEIFEQYGEPFFRQKEAQVIQRLLEDEPIVLATGGGAFVNAPTRDLIGRLGFSIWLTVPIDVLWSRVKDKTHRPLLQIENPEEALKNLATERNPSYALADCNIEVPKQATIDEACDLVEAKLRLNGILKAN